MRRAAKRDRPLILITLLFATPAVTVGQCSKPEAAAAADALAAKFDSHQFVLIGSTHGDVKIDEFLMCLVTRPAFQQRATDIVVEWASGSVANQRLLDRYMLNFEEMHQKELVSIWFDTDHPTLWATMPHVRYFVRTLRDVNKTLPASKRIRLIGGNDRDMTGAIAFSPAQQQELKRRNTIKSDPQRAMRARFQNRDQWFRAHPNDFPPRPVIKEQ